MLYHPPCVQVAETAIRHGIILDIGERCLPKSSRSVGGCQSRLNLGGRVIQVKIVNRLVVDSVPLS